MEEHLKEKRAELIWALEIQGYKQAQIGRLFNITPVKVNRIVKSKPDGWQPKWKKVL